MAPASKDFIETEMWVEIGDMMRQPFAQIAADTIILFAAQWNQYLRSVREIAAMTSAI
jgi:hypothetical protein